ncbi:MAG: hypothetical protein HKN28_05160 [Alphaproteobacteria bacterium]|nr:hypothetical protein [Alphaproteobacteria bacterium]
MYYWNKDDFAGLEVLADYVSMHCPHTTGLTFASRERLGDWAAAQLIDVLNGKRPPRLINPDAWALSKNATRNGWHRRSAGLISGGFTADSRREPARVFAAGFGSTRTSLTNPVRPSQTGRRDYMLRQSPACSNASATRKTVASS